MILDKYSMGIGDRFARQGQAQLQAFIEAKKRDARVAPIWNKSHREHTIVKTSPQDVLAEAQEAVKALNWQDAYYVDADHIGLRNVDLFIDSSNFFTLDVADFTGKTADQAAIDQFAAHNGQYVGKLVIPGIEEQFTVAPETIRQIAAKYLLAVQEAGKIYRHIEAVKGKGNFITEVSMDETDQPQNPLELFFILAAIAQEGIPAQTIAPKFTGRFNKGVEYVGDLDRFTTEFNQDLAVIQFAVKEFGLPANLKLSVHSGSDKFSLYKPMREALKKFNVGLHLKTAGTTWLEEVAGLALGQGRGLQIARQIYTSAYNRFNELCHPYATVIAIDKERLPGPREVEKWDAELFYHTLRHDQTNKHYNPHFRQLIHVAYKVAAEMGSVYLSALDEFRDIISVNVRDNIFEKHLKPLFLPEKE